MERIRRNVPVCLMTATKTVSMMKEVQRLHNHASAMPSAHISLSPGLLSANIFPVLGCFNVFPLSVALESALTRLKSELAKFPRSSFSVPTSGALSKARSLH